MSGKVCVLYEWPNSQICIDCKNGCFVQSDDTEAIGSSAYLCLEAERSNDGVTCPSKVSEDEDTEESEQ